jgi:predicted Zn-dependent protease with MMP-like domain
MNMQRTDFEKLVVDALDDLPDEFQRKLENIDVVVEDEPSEDTLKRMNIIPPRILLGLYQGVPLSRRGRGYANVMPDKISIYQTPIESICRTEEELKERVREVVMHEIGHYFGLSEEQIRKA